MKKFFNSLTRNMLILIELGIAFLISVLPLVFKINPDTGWMIPKYLSFIPILLFLIILFCFVLEFIKRKAFGRLIYLIFSIALVVSLSNNIETFNMNLWFFSFFYMIIMLLKALNLKRENKKIEKEKTKTLPVFVFSNKQTIYSSLCALGILLFDILFLALWIKLFEKTFVVCLVIEFIITYIGFIIVALIVSPVQKAINIMNKEVDYNKVNNILDEVLQNNLHEDSVIYINLLKVNYLFMKDLNKALSLFETINIPNNKECYASYRRIEIVYYLNKGDYNKAIELVKQYKKEIGGLKIIKLDKIIKSLDKNYKINNVEKMFKITSKSMFVNLSNAYFLMYYYRNRNDYNKVNEYANYIRLNGQNLTYIYNEVNR